MLKLDHVVFPVRDAGVSLRFYRDILGLPLADAISGDDWGGYPWLMMTFDLPGGGEIVLVALRGAPETTPSGPPRDVRHYALSTASPLNLIGWRRRLNEAGVAYWEEGHGERQSIYFEDPDGVVLEITAPPLESDKGADRDAQAVVARWMASRP
jgi:catechol 2,3-dioxygenase-like lactoylglutathione lyase family enzyme